MEEIRPNSRVLALSVLGLAFFLAWEALALRSYTRVESRPPAWDQAVHMEIALDYRDALKAGDWSKIMRPAPKPGMPPFPPIYHLLLRYAYASGDPANAALWLNWFYLAILAVALFGLAWSFRPDETALLCVLIFAGSPMVQDMLHTQLVDLAVAAWAVAAYWALVRSEDFENWGGSLAFGVLCAVGMMHKWSFFSYLFPAAYLALKALAKPSSRLKVLAAAAVAAAVGMPWYLMNLVVMVPRLFQASADFAIPFWRGAAVVNYLGQMVDGMGPLFLMLSLIGICIPQYRRNWHRGWILTAWFVSSYIFWTLVPNRQLRFLLPALPALAVAGMGTWPKAVLWGLAAVQLFTMANFTSGWMAPISIPAPWSGRVELFPSQPPAHEDWKIAEILAEAEKRADPDRPIADLVLVANDMRFNCINFDWTAKLRKLPRVRVRGVNNRLCEFAQFFVLKEGSLGPENVIGSLPQAAQIIKDAHGWFARAYEAVGRWPLPDGSAAVLYQQRRPSQPPVPERKVHFQYYEEGEFKAADLAIELMDWDAQRGVYRRATASAREVQLRGLRLTGLRVEMDGLRFVPIYAGDSRAWMDLRFLQLDALRIMSLRVDGEALRAFLESRAKGLHIERLDIDKTLKARGKFGQFSVEAQVAAGLQDSPRALRLELRDARLGATPLPDFILHPFRSFVQPFAPTTDMPFAIDVAGLTLSGGVLSVP